VVATVAVAAVECVAAVAAETEADVVVDVVRILRCDSNPESSNANIIQADSVAVTGVDVAVECVVAAHPEVVVVTAVAVVLPVAVPAQRAVLRLSS
jgi:hypothetical protein